MLPTLTPAVLAIAMLAARPAYADAVRDFKAGTIVMVHTAGVDLGDGPRSTGGAALAKPTGTLDFTIAAADLGMQLPVTIDLHGSIGRGEFVFFSVDNRYAPEVTLGPGYSLSRITGLLQARVTRVPGAAAPRAGNVQLTMLPGSYLHAHGSWGMQTIAITGTHLTGGVTQPELDAIVHTGDRLLCSDSVATTQTFAVWLPDVAQPGGAAVDLRATMRSGFDLPPAAIVPAGRRSTTVTAKIAPNYAGSVHLTAAAGGVTRSLALDIRPRRDCDGGPASRPAVETWTPSALAGCTNCASYVAINHANEKLASIDRRFVVFRGAQKIDLATAFPTATTVSASAMNNDGTLTGQITLGGVLQAYRANMNHGTPVPELLGAMAPVAINNYGVVVGARVTTAGHEAVYSNGTGVLPLTLTSAYGISASRALDITDSGHVIGTYTDKTGVTRGFRWLRGATSTLPVVGTRPAIPVGVNRAGQIAVNGVSSGGLPVAALVAPTNTFATLGIPSGYISFEARSINRFGAIAGVAKTSAGTARAFVWRSGRGFTPLTSYLPNLVATDALRITDANQVVVRGTYNGAADLYLITL